MEQKQKSENSSAVLKRTFSELQHVDVVVGQIYADFPGLKENTKFSYAYKRFLEKNFQPTLKEFQDAIAFVRLDNALEDEKTKEVLFDSTPGSRGYKYSKEGLRKCMEEEVKMIDKYNAKEIVIEPYISSQVPEGLTKEQTEVLKGLVI